MSDCAVLVRDGSRPTDGVKLSKIVRLQQENSRLRAEV